MPDTQHRLSGLASFGASLSQPHTPFLHCCWASFGPPPRPNYIIYKLYNLYFPVNPPFFHSRTAETAPPHTSEARLRCT